MFLLVAADRPNEIGAAMRSTLSFNQFTIRTGQIHVWRIPLSANQNSIRIARLLLSKDEVMRADRFCFERDRRRFTVARASLRRVLACYIKMEAQHLVFDYSHSGKPRLSNTQESTPLNFNLSHSGDVSLLAIAPDFSLGIDIERVVEFDAKLRDVARHFFSSDEFENLQALPDAQKSQAFFSYWTRKEAYIKAQGAGLAIPLNSFSVSRSDDDGAGNIRVYGDPGTTRIWTILDLEAGPGYKAALAVATTDFELHRQNWADD